MKLSVEVDMRRLKMLAAISAVILCGGLSLAAAARTVGCVANPADGAKNGVRDNLSDM